MIARKQARIRVLRNLAAFASACAFSLSALAQELLPPLYYSYQEIELPDAMGHYEESKTKLLENDAVISMTTAGRSIESTAAGRWTAEGDNGYIDVYLFIAGQGEGRKEARR